MRIALFSDIHANLPALLAVLHHLDDQPHLDALYCLGDLVGYAPWPNQVVDEIRRRRIPTLAGNYDVGVGLHSDDCGCAYNTDADRQNGARSIGYTNRVMGHEQRAYLRSLPQHIRLHLASGSTALWVHGSPRRVNEYLFDDRPADSLLRLLAQADADLLACGHTHKPWYRALAYTTAEGQTRYRHAVNIGSVGKPKDGDPRACYALLTLPDDTPLSHLPLLDVQFVRVPYPVAEAAAAIRATPDLPAVFADRLEDAR